MSTPCTFHRHAHVYSAHFPRRPPNSVEHIVGNLVMQLLLGIPLELVHKGFEVGMVYLAGVLAGEHHLYSQCGKAGSVIVKAAFKVLSTQTCAIKSS